MKIILMAAMSPDRVIGQHGKIPWHYPADLRFVKRTTVGHPCLMGRKTYESLPRRPLPDRVNIILTSSDDYVVPSGVVVCSSFEKARQHCEQLKEKSMFVLGGEGVYREALPHAHKLLITHVPDLVSGDVHFPAWDENQWALTESNEEEGLLFATYVRKLQTKD